MPREETRGRGRPPRDVTDRRAAILEAARESFAARGFRDTTIRAVAASAGVDAALVHHYFGSKNDLFLASLEVPFDPRTVIPAVMAGDLDTAAWRLLDTVLEIWDHPAVRLQLAALLRTGLAAPAESNPLRDGLLPLILGPLAEHLPEPDPVGRAHYSTHDEFRGGGRRAAHRARRSPRGGRGLLRGSLG